jgi:uncharacterized coiled-coil DUF342 family protein
VAKMSDSVLTESREQHLVQPVQIDSMPVIEQVEEIKDTVSATISETNLSEKMSDLRVMLDNLTDEVDSWRAWHKIDYLEVIETLKSQVEEMHNEWNNVSESMKTQREKLESLLESFPGVIETSTLKALSLRITHLEQLVSQIFHESQTKNALRGSKKQYITSLIALGVTVVLWGAFIGMNLMK